MFSRMLFCCLVGAVPARWTHCCARSRYSFASDISTPRLSPPVRLRGRSGHNQGGSCNADRTMSLGMVRSKSEAGDAAVGSNVEVVGCGNECLEMTHAS